MRRPLVLLLILMSFLPACDDTPPVQHPTPDWAKEAIWYQIFVERFWNGDPQNDPTLTDIEGSWPHLRPEGWGVTEWTAPWYRQEAWAKETGKPFYTTVQSRRFGGDLAGVLAKLDYLEDLGITAIYFNPLNDAPSLHKYDARNYRHIDRNFGPDPEGDGAIMDSEDPNDPETWVWTAADSLFLKLVDEIHMRGMRVIVDYSWNHTGITFWAWRDLVEKQAESEFRDWYQVAEFDDPATPENEFEYEGWAGVAELPNLQKVGGHLYEPGRPATGDLNAGAKELVFNVTRRWLDPNQDGDPSDGVDGFRLDVAEHLPLEFWREYRDLVKSVNPDAYLVGEIWWERWPEKMMEPHPYLGDVFDAVMNYRLYMPTRALLGEDSVMILPSEFVRHVDSVESGIHKENLLAMMNVTATHDSPRVVTSLANNNRYKFRAKPQDDPRYMVARPHDRTRARQKLLVMFQFTYPGGPHIWNGDELGMWGADDPDNRQPLWWPGLAFEDETYDVLGFDVADTREPDMDVHAFYRELARFRNEYSDVLSHGTVEFILAEDERKLIGLARALPGSEIVTLLNVGDEDQVLSAGEFSANKQILAIGNCTVQSDSQTVTISALSGCIFVQ